jgi:hypothetical protein
MPVDLVERVNAMHWDGPLRGRLAVIARKKLDTVEVCVGIDGQISTVLHFPKGQMNCDGLADATKQILAAAGQLVVAEVSSLFRHGPKLDLRVQTMADVDDALTIALGHHNWASPVDAIEQLAQTNRALARALQSGSPELGVQADQEATATC